ncbi:MAG: hypothetical protein QG608_555, partial [Actinomycetota bacterium]|nr:hypothetical protein [Actinomycetota bacterium]
EPLTPRTGTPVLGTLPAPAFPERSSAPAEPDRPGTEESYRRPAPAPAQGQHVRSGASPRLPDTVSSMLGSHPLVHPFTGDLRITAPNRPQPSEQPSGHQDAGQENVGHQDYSPENAGGENAGGEQPARTRNGLRKRTPRPTRSVSATAHAAGATVTRSAVLDDSPVQVSSRLTALRAGIERGQKRAVTVVGCGDGAEQGGQRLQ